MIPYPMKLEPILMQRLWGGRRLAEMFGKVLPDEQPYGESWEVSDVPAHASVIVNGPLTGRSLRDLMVEDAAGLLGEARCAEGGRFPLLVKLLDCSDVLSVQVHPDEAACRLLGGHARPKTESWIVLHADPGAKIYLGLAAGVTRPQFEAALAEGTVEKLLNVIEPAVGDCLYITSGTVHALGAGLVLAEIQQTSDTTYRVYDWGRLGPDGRPRPLHVEQALASIHFVEAEPPTPQVPRPLEGSDGVEGAVLLDEPYARICRLASVTPFTIEGSGVATILQCVGGDAMLTGGGQRVRIATGDAILLPAAVEDVDVEPISEGVALLTSKPK